MTRAALLLTLLAGCTDAIVCGDGTIERDGRCEAADTSADPGTCGPNTELQGDQCVPTNPPTICDPTTTTEQIDPNTGEVVCIGTGGGGCDATFACPAPVDNTHQTICGQLFDLETGMPFRQSGDATGARCASTTTDGPCSLHINAYDAIQFGDDPTMAQPLTTGEVYIDDCGRYRVPDIATPSAPFIGLGIDDADMAKRGPAGTTNSVGVATGTRAGTSTKDFDGWIAAKSTTDKWEASGGPPVSSGIFVPIFRKHKVPASGQPPLTLAQLRELQDGVTVTKSGTAQPAIDHYFTPAQITRETIDPSASATGANGTALVTGASLDDGVFAYSGTGGDLSTSCKWEQHAGVSLPNILVVQDFRPMNVVGMTCDR